MRSELRWASRPQPGAHRRGIACCSSSVHDRVLRLLGLVASVALVIYTVLFLGILNGIGVTMTLPGIAGIILTLGMA